MRCTNCNTAIGYNLLMQWWYQTDDAEQFAHPCPFCSAHLHIEVYASIIFRVMTFRGSQYLPPEPH